MTQVAYHLKEAALAPLTQLVKDSGFFSEEEVQIADELALDIVQKQALSDYRAVTISDAGTLMGFSFWGKIPCTLSSYDLYWIVVGRAFQGRGLGRSLLAEVEQNIRQIGGTRLYADTSGRDQYQPTRQFYLATGFCEVAQLEDFYAPGDAKVIFLKKLS